LYGPYTICGPRCQAQVTWLQVSTTVMACSKDSNLGKPAWQFLIPAAFPLMLKGMSACRGAGWGH
jgi:ABC-type anion transport system duplicated permease subunit